MKTEPKVNILLVDDEPANLVSLEAILECLGQNLVKANSGTEALRSVLNNDFAVILLDVQMPDLNGFDTAAAIRARERSRQIPIIFLTGVVKTSEMMFKGYTTGAVDYLTKPIVAGILRAKVEVFVELAMAREKLRAEVAERTRFANEIAKLNMTLEERNQELTAANTDLETFGHTVSHDLRAPLRHIQGYIGFVRESLESKLDDDTRTQMEKISAAAQRMSKLIDDLLAFSRTGRAGINKVPLDMNDLAKETISQLQPDLEERSVAWTVRELPKVKGDRNLLGQVWFNLLGNAVKYTRPRPEARIEIGAEIQDKEVVFYVRDNGVGFNSDNKERLFGVFQRLHSDKEFEGTGIGLANVRRIVQRHGGQTWAESSEGEGATFYFSIPQG